MTLYRNLTPSNMPCNPPTVFANYNGCEKNGQYFNNYVPPQNCKPFPDVIGEGEVTSLVSPDGTVQYFFMPTKWCTPYSYYPQTFNNYSLGAPNTGVWFVKRILNSRVPSFYPPCYSFEVPQPTVGLDCDIYSLSVNGLPIKFHNDKLTSTSDIHYFYPCLRQYGYCPINQTTCPKSQPAVGHAAVQVVSPVVNTMCHYEVMCSKPCHCNDRCKPMSVTSIDVKQSTVKCGSNDTIIPMTKDKSTGEVKSKRRKQESKSTTKHKQNIICCCPANTAESTQTSKDEACAPCSIQDTQTCTSRSDNKIQTCFGNYQTSHEEHETQTFINKSPCGRNCGPPTCLIENDPPSGKDNYSDNENTPICNKQQEELQKSSETKPCTRDISTVLNRLEDTLELWYPKTPLSRKTLLTESGYSKQQDLSSTTAASSCSCFTDMDLTE